MNRVEQLAVELYRRGNSPKDVSELLSITPRVVNNLIVRTGIRRDIPQAAVAWKDNARARATINNFTILVDAIEHCAYKLNIPVSLLLLVLTERLAPGPQDRPTCVATSACDFDCARQCARALDESSEQRNPANGDSHAN